LSEDPDGVGRAVRSSMASRRWTKASAHERPAVIFIPAAQRRLRR
jgi:hypothetical protein